MDEATHRRKDIGLRKVEIGLIAIGFLLTSASIWHSARSLKIETGKMRIDFEKETFDLIGKLAADVRMSADTQEQYKRFKLEDSDKLLEVRKLRNDAQQLLARIHIVRGKTDPVYKSLENISTSLNGFRIDEKGVWNGSLGDAEPECTGLLDACQLHVQTLMSE